MRSLETYTELLTRQAAEIRRAIDADQDLLRLTCVVFINRNIMEKHPDCVALNEKRGVAPCLLWRGDVVAEHDDEGIILVSRYSYPVTSILERELLKRGWTKVSNVTRHEHGWISPARLGDIVREYLEDAA